MKRLLIFATLLIFTACAAATVEPVAPTAAPTNTLQPSPTLSPDPTLTAVPSPSPTIPQPILSPFPTIPLTTPTPDFMDTHIVNEYLFAPSVDPDCQLPCWQGLRIGESTKEDVVRMFDEVLDIREGLKLSTDESITRIPGTELIWYWWDIRDTEGNLDGWFTLKTILDDETDILQCIDIVTAPYEMYEIQTPQQVIRELGRPSAIYVDNTSFYLMNLMLLYDEGIVSLSTTAISIDEQPIGEHTVEVVTNYCLNEIPLSREVIIVESVNDITAASLTPILNAWVGEDLLEALVPIEDALGLTEEAFVKIALDDENPCIALD